MIHVGFTSNLHPCDLSQMCTPYHAPCSQFIIFNPDVLQPSGRSYRQGAGEKSPHGPWWHPLFSHPFHERPDPWRWLNWRSPSNRPIAPSQIPERELLRCFAEADRQWPIRLQLTDWGEFLQWRFSASIRSGLNDQSGTTRATSIGPDDWCFDGLCYWYNESLR